MAEPTNPLAPISATFLFIFYFFLVFVFCCFSVLLYFVYCKLREKVREWENGILVSVGFMDVSIVDFQR